MVSNDVLGDTASRHEGLGVFGKMATLRERKLREKDRLTVLARYSFHQATRLPVRICFIYVFCQYFFATSVTIYHLLSTFNQEELLKHGSFCGIQIFVLINLAPLVFTIDNITKFLKKYADVVLPLEMMTEDKAKTLLLVFKLVKVICVVNMILAVLAAAGFIAAPDYFDKRTYLCVWIQETFPDYSNIMLHVVHWTSLPVALGLAGASVGWAYGGMLVVTQVLILHDMISSISDSDLPEDMRRDSKVYQECIKQKMIMSIMTHEYTVRFQAVASEIVEVPMMTLALGSLILGGSLMLEYFSNQDQNFGDQYEVYIGILCFTCAGVISANIYLILGQVIKDESTTCNYKLCQLPWYEMNKENKKIYAIFLERSNKNLAISNSLMQIDYELLVRICKSLYSLAAVMSRFASPGENAG